MIGREWSGVTARVYPKDFVILMPLDLPPTQHDCPHQMQEEEDKAAEERRRREQLQAQKAAALPPEPPADATEPLLTCLLRFPDGSRHSRRFKLADSLQASCLVVDR